MSYYCSRGMTQRGTHPRVYVSERLLLDWVRSESARLRTPNRVKLAEANRDERRKLEDQRERLGWALADGLLDRDAARARALEIDSELEALDAQEEVVDVPTIDWAWPTDALNDVLRAIWRYIELDENLRPVRAEWTVPAWRSGRATSARESTPVDATPVS